MKPLIMLCYVMLCYVYITKKLTVEDPKRNSMVQISTPWGDP